MGDCVLKFNGSEPAYIGPILQQVEHGATVNVDKAKAETLLSLKLQEQGKEIPAFTLVDDHCTSPGGWTDDLDDE